MLRVAPTAIAGLALVASGCFVDRSGTFRPDADVEADAGVDDGGSECAPGTVDADGDPANGCECTLASPPTEVCANADDEDCDGRVDEGCACSPGETMSCGADVGTCTRGARTCAPDTTWGACEGASTGLTCVGVDLLRCDPAGGAPALVETCALGCEEASASMGRCLELVPSNGISPDWLDEGDAVLDDGLGTLVRFEWNTASGEVIGYSSGGARTEVRPGGEGVLAGVGFHLVAQGGGSPDIGVWAFRSVTFAAGSTHRFYAPGVPSGAVGPAAAVVSAGAIVVDGALDLSASDEGGTRDNDSYGGPGGWEGGRLDVDHGAGRARGAGPGGGAGLDFDCDSGGAGGGHGALGGAGGLAAGDPFCTSPPPAPVGGAATGDPSLSPLAGGSGGGAGGGVDTFRSGDGGGGGGAIQLVSGAEIRLGGSIRAAGGGGEGSGDCDAGGGGGAGGAVLFEAPVLTIDPLGVVAANGGGGGSGSDMCGGGSGNDGSAGSLSATRAAAGASIGSTSGAGGAGGAGSTPEGAAGDTAPNGGGGGGAAGRVRINTLGGAATIDGTVSPDPAMGVIATR